MRTFVQWIQKERGIGYRTINYVIAQLHFFTLYVLHQPWDPYQVPYRKAYGFSYDKENELFFYTSGDTTYYCNCAACIYMHEGHDFVVPGREAEDSESDAADDVGETEKELFVEGKTVSDELLSGANWSYDKETNTLTLDNYTYEGNGMFSEATDDVDEEPADDDEDLDDIDDSDCDDDEDWEYEDDDTDDEFSEEDSDDDSEGDASGDNTSSIYGDKNHKYVNSDNASNIAKIDEGKRRTRTTDVSFKFTKAGYYMYKIEEVGSVQNGTSDSLSGLKKDVAGVDYDNNSYYVVFYVCNKEATADVNANEYGQGTQKGDTIGQEGSLNKVNTDGTQTAETSDNGVYVHTITSWTNQNANTAAGKGATDYKPDNTMRTSDALANAQNFLNDLQQAQDEESNGIALTAVFRKSDEASDMFSMIFTSDNN